jgi:Tfp pilus assembly protein PilO
MNTPMKIAVAVVIIALMGLGFYVVDWSEKKKKIEELQGQYQEKEEQKKRLEEDVAKLDEYEKEAEQLEKELLSLVQSKFTQEEPELFVANYIAEIERMVVGQQEATGDYDFKITQISPKGEKRTQVNTEGGEGAEAEEAASAAEESETLQGFPTRVFDMQMTGRYATLVDFLYELGALELDRLVTINKITLQPEVTEGGGSPILTVTIPITAYLRTGSK